MFIYYSGKKKHFYVINNAFYTELDLQICNYAQERRICRENSKYTAAENCYGHFYMIYIANYNELDLQICNYAQ